MNMHDFLNKESILLNVEASNYREVIELLGEKLREQGYVKDDFVAAALEREKNMPTGLPLSGGINAAIPHVDIEYVNQPALGLATLKNEVDFYNMVDHQQAVPCRLVIMLALDQPKSQIEMLQNVAGILQSPETVKEIMASTSSQEVLDVLQK